MMLPRVDVPADVLEELLAVEVVPAPQPLSTTLLPMSSAARMFDFFIVVLFLKKDPQAQWGLWVCLLFTSEGRPVRCVLHRFLPVEQERTQYLRCDVHGVAHVRGALGGRHDARGVHAVDVQYSLRASR